MRLMHYQAAILEEPDKFESPDYIFQITVHNHRPSLEIVQDPHGHLEDFRRLNVSPRAEILSHVELGLWFCRFAAHWRLFFENTTWFPYREPAVDEFPNERNSRPKYHLPKNWQYGKGLIIINTERLTGDFCVFRAREQRL